MSDRLVKGEDAEVFSNLPEASTEGPPPLTFNTQVNQVDASLHVHEAMLIPDADVAERIEKIYPGFMREVMEGRRREQRARLLRESRQQSQEHELMMARVEGDQAARMKKIELRFQHFSGATSLIIVLGIIFAVIGIIALIRGSYWTATGMGTGMAYSFAQVVRLLKIAKESE